MNVRATISYNRSCLQAYCGYSSGDQIVSRWASLKFAWHWLFCHWARWPTGRSLPPRHDSLKQRVTVLGAETRRYDDEFTP